MAARIIDGLRNRGGLLGRDIANIVGVSPAMVARWSDGIGQPSPHTQAVIASLHYIVERLSDVYTADEARRWLYARHSLLNGERAVDLITQGRTEDVLAVIDRLEAGAYL